VVSKHKNKNKLVQLMHIGRFSLFLFHTGLGCPRQDPFAMQHKASVTATSFQGDVTGFCIPSFL